jgi:hypothetical protein
LKNFLNSKAFGTAFGIDVRDAFAQASGINFTPFFDQWYFGEGFPTYSVQWKQLGNDALVQISHSTSAPNVTPTFTNPIELKFVRPGNTDTTIRFDITSNSNLFQINGIGTLSNSISIDPQNWIVNQNGTITMNELLDLESLNTSQETEFYLYPNPSNEEIYVKNIPNDCRFIIYDMYGKVKLMDKVSNSNLLNISSLPSGNYLLILDGTTVKYRKTFVKL